MRPAVALAALALMACGPSHPRPAPVRVAPLPATAYAEYLRGRIELEQDHPRRAAEHFRAAAVAAPAEAPIRASLIEALLAADDAGAAWAEALAARREFPGSAAVWAITGRAARRAHHTREIVPAFERAVTLDPTDEESWLELAAAQLDQHRDGDAERTYRRMLGHHPYSVDGNYRLARLLTARGHGGEAVPLLRRVLESAPGHLDAQLALARLLRGRGERAAGMTVLRSAFDHAGGEAAVAERMFYRLLDLGDPAAAADLIGGLDRDDLDPGVRVDLGYLHLHVGRAEPALRLARSLLRRHPGSGEARLLEAQALRILHRADQAIAGLTAVAPDDPAWADCLVTAAELRADAGDGPGAIALLDRAPPERAGEPRLVLGRAVVLDRGGDHAGARQLVAGALERRPDDLELLFGAASLADRQGEFQRAEELVDRILAVQPDHVGALNLLGYSLADRDERLDRAEALLRRAVALVPLNGYVLDSLGWLLLRRHRVDEAARVLARAARLAPMEPEILWHLGELEAERGHRGRALTLLERARSLDPEQSVRTRIERRIEALRPGP